MTTTVTEREIRFEHNGRVPKVDSPAVSTRARARLPVTQRIGKIGVLARSGLFRWWAWSARPPSLRTSWRLSAVTPKRVPAASGLLRFLWKLSNTTDRLVLFGLILAAPTVVSGPLRWLAMRPTRRWGLYLSLVAFAITFIT